MDKIEIQYTSSDEQIKKLESQHLIIKDKATAKQHLNTFGYSNLIKSYREPYVIVENSKKLYRSGVTFEQITSLFLLDKNLRNAVFSSMLDLEEHVKACTADVIAEAFGTDPDQYLQFRNYRDKRKNKPQFRLSYILNKMRIALQTDKNPIHHYQDTYGSVPPWILFNSMYFTTIVNFIDLLKKTEQEAIAKKLYPTIRIPLQADGLRKLMMDTLFICVEYRNISAHGGRIYNHKSSSELRGDEIFEDYKNPAIEINGFSRLIFLLSLLYYQNPFLRLDNILQEELTRHCSVYPDDITYLSRTLNVNIVTTDVVYISGNSDKFHSNPHCSGMENTKEIPYEEAMKNKLTPCKRCFKDFTPQ